MMTSPVEQKLLDEHKKLLEFCAGFLCSGCDKPRSKKLLSKMEVFRPRKNYSLFRQTTYLICNECAEKLDDAAIYDAVERWLMARGHLAL